MKLIRVHVKEFQSIRDSSEFNIGDITCLVGKNEAGKTAILRALYRLNPVLESESKFDVTDDYPRADVEDYQQQIEKRQREHAKVIQATFELTDELEGIASDLGSDSMKSNEVILRKSYDNKLSYELQFRIRPSLSKSVPVSKPF